MMIRNRIFATYYSKLKYMIKNTQNESSNSRVKVGISQGDINGVGYEIMIKSFFDNRIFDELTPIVFGMSKVASYHRKTLDIKDFSFNIIKKPEQANHKRANIINCQEEEVIIDLGKSTEIAGKMSLQSLECAIQCLKNNEIDVLVTAPINKENIQSDKFDFPGHTEYLAQKFETENYLMLMVSNNLRIGAITGHIPIKDVSSNLSKELIYSKINVLNKSLKKDFAICKPKIAILSLNPHAGDKGLIGSEDTEIVTPSIKKAFDDGILAFGPYPADGFFGTSNYQKFDGILAMYHDQAMIPFKTLSFDSGVNFTAGLPIIRTSPAHGTAYDIAGKNQASPSSFLQAIYLAVDIFRNRQMHNKINSNPLKFGSSEKNGDAKKND